MNHKRLVFASFLLVTGSFFTILAISPVHAQTGMVCIISSDATSCPASPASITGTVGTQLKVTVFIQGSDVINGFDITLLGNHTILKPAGYDLNGTILPFPQKVVVECLSGLEKILSGPQCSSTDTPDTLHLAVAGASGQISSMTSGILFHAIYNVTSSTPSTSLGFQTGCGSTTSHPPLCATITNGTASAVVENIQTATFGTGLAAPTITTTVSRGGMIPRGGTVYDNATLQGATSSAGGTVNYNLYNIGDCSGTASASSTVIVTNSKVPGSGTFQTGPAGNYGFQAVYSGDANNTGAISTCEPFTVCLGCGPSITISLSSTKIQVGSSVTASATLAGAFQPTGTVSYLLSSVDCSGSFNTVSTVNVSSGTVPSSRAVIFNATGSYGWVAFYSGDVNNPTATSACAPLSIVSPDFAISANPPSLQLIEGTTGTSTITFTSLNGFNGTVSTSTSPPPLCPSCSAWSISPSSLKLTANGSANATLTITAGNSPFSANVTVFGVSGTLSHSVAVRFTVPAPDFTITASPSSQSTARGSSALFTISVRGVNGFNSTVSLTATLSPVVKHGPTFSLPASVGPYSTSTLTVSTVKNTPTGSYTITVTATSGSLTHTVTVTIIVSR